MDDYLVRAVDAGRRVRVLAVRSTGVVEEARRRHGTRPVATAALGRALSAGLLLGANLKGEDLLTLRILGDGPLGAVVVTADARGNVRGYVQHPEVDLPPTAEGKLAVGAAVGRGHLYVTRDLGFGAPFTGGAALVTGEIAADLTHYLATSEQTPSAVVLGVRVGPGGEVQGAGGLLVQLLPDSAEDLAGRLEENLGELREISALVASGVSPEELAARVLAPEAPTVLGRTPVRFACTCSRDKVVGLLAALGEGELAALARDHGEITVRCHFCGADYRFARGEVLGALSS
ncbi:MAG: Hsp33 family molecular chaperone HslO [Firmicutes bacterium]|nr:Hsp33 family molecular chaperone HslO [Bacillota bacterium]